MLDSKTIMFISDVEEEHKHYNANLYSDEECQNKMAKIAAKYLIGKDFAEIGEVESLGQRLGLVK